MKHTQGKWEISTMVISDQAIVSKGNEGQIYIKATAPDQDSQIVAEIRVLNDTLNKTKRKDLYNAECPERDANAEYIVKACNEYDRLKQDRAELVQELKGALTYLRDDRAYSCWKKPEALLKKLGEL